MTAAAELFAITISSVAPRNTPFKLPPLQTMSANPALAKMPDTLVEQLNTVSVWCWWRTKDDAALKLVFWPDELVTWTCG